MTAYEGDAIDLNSITQNKYQHKKRLPKANDAM